MGAFTPKSPKSPHVTNGYRLRDTVERVKKEKEVKEVKKKGSNKNQREVPIYNCGK